MTNNMASGLAGFLSDSDWPFSSIGFPTLFTVPKRPSTPTTATSPDGPLDGWPSRADLSDELLQRVYDSICADAGCAPTSILEPVLPNVKSPSHLANGEEDSRSTTGGPRSPKSDYSPCAEERIVLRLAATSQDWPAAFDATCALLSPEQQSATREQPSNTDGLLEHLKPTDLIYLCSSLTTHWPYVLLPEALLHLAEPDPNASNEAQSLRNICTILQSLLLTGKRRVGVLERRNPAKEIILAAMAHLSRSSATIEAFAPLFFDCVPSQASQSEDGQASAAYSTFRVSLMRTAPFGFLQHIFETFVLALARARRWRALTYLLAGSRVGEKLVMPVIALKKDAPWLILPEAGEISGVRQDILVDLRFPPLAILAMLEDVCRSSNSPDGPFYQMGSTLFQSVFPILCCRAYSDEMLTHKLWHRDALIPASLEELLPTGVMGHLHSLISIKETGLVEGDQRDRGSHGYIGDMERVLTTFVFVNDAVLGGTLEEILRMEDGETWGINHMRRVPELWRRVHESSSASEKYYSVLELWARICETYLLADKRSPVSELLELGDNTTRESVLDTSRRTVYELTGCDLTHIEIYLMRLLEAFESQHGISSDLPGLMGPRKTFVAALTLSPLIYNWFLLPIVEAKLQPSAYCCSNRKVSPSPVGDSGRETRKDDGLVYPTLLPVHVAEFLPAWFGTRGTLMSTFGNSSRQYIGWRALCLELLAVSITPTPDAQEMIVAPHLTSEALKHFVRLYTDCANPRALHLLTRLTAEGSDCHVNMTFLVELLTKAKVSRFVLMADAIAQFFVYDDTSTGMELCDLIIEVYLSAERGHDASLFLRSLGDSDGARIIGEKWKAEVDRVIGGSEAEEIYGSPSATSGAQTLHHTRTMRWRKAVQILKGMSNNVGADSAKGAVALFHDLRKSPGGIPDISVANKVIHICITHGKLSDADKLYCILRNDAHQGSSLVRPDVVTCNILLKGLAKKKPPHIEEMERLIRQMEMPFELGGDGITADQVTYNTMINAAVVAGSFSRAWDYLTEMRTRGIKVDGFTCSILMKQITPSTKPELIQEILQLLDDLDPIEDPVLLSSIVDVYSRLRDLDRLSSTLDRYQRKVPNPTPYALATLVKGYGRCGLLNQAAGLWQRLEMMADVQWSPYIFGCAVDCFVANGDLDRALGVLTKASAANVSVSDLQYSVLIRACTQRRRLHDALRLYKEMKANGLQPCDVTYNNLMHLCVVAGDLETAVEILNDMTHNARHRPDVVTYSTIIKGLCDRGAMKLAAQLFEDIPRRGVEPDVVAYNTLLEGFAKADDVEQVEAVYAQLLERNVKPTCYTLTIMVKFYGRRHQLDRVLHLVDTLPRLYAIRMDAFVYTATIAACTWNGRVDKAIGFLEAMRASFGASARTYGTLVAGCVRQQSWQPLSVVLKYAAEDNVILGKRDASSLHELLQEWTTKNIAHKWFRTGFDHVAAAQLKHFLTGQRTGVGPGRRALERRE